MKQFFDRCAYTFAGALLVAFLWFCHASYSEAQRFGYTPDVRAHMNYLAEIYNTDQEIPEGPVRLSISDLE